MRHAIVCAAFLSALSTHAQVFSDGFEEWTGGVPLHWMGAQTTLSIDNVQQVTGDAHSGTYALRFWQPAVGLTHFTSEQVHLDTGNFYQVGFWAKGTGVVASALFDDHDTNQGFLTGATVNVNSTTWQYYVSEFFCQHTTDIGEVIFTLAITYAPDHLMIDDVSLMLNNPPPPPFLSIQQIQTPIGGSDNSPYLGSMVVTTGIVTAITTDGYQFYIQNGTGPYSGVCISEFTGAELQMGDSVRVTGYVVETGDQETQLACNNGFELLASGSPMPAPELLELPLADLEPWEGVLATVENVTCVNINAWGSWDGTVSSSTDLGVGVLFYISAVAEGSTYNVTGIMHYEWPLDKLEPRVQEDVTEVVGVEELSHDQLQISPNPTSDLIHLNIDEINGRMEYTIADATGRVAKSGSLTSNPASGAGQAVLAVDELTNGLYMLTLRSNEGVRQARVMVQR